MQDPSDARKPKTGLHRGLALVALLLAGGLASPAATALLPWQAAANIQNLPTIGVDADPAGNTATSLKEIDACAARTTGDIFDVDIFIQDVNRLLAWEFYIEYDPQTLEVLHRRVDLFQAANRGSNVYDVSERLPDDDGLYRIAAADTSDPPTPDSGSGVLARLTFRARAPGLNTIAFASLDIDEDGQLDRAPFLRDVDAEPIGDIDGDSFFDGPTESAQVAVDRRCLVTSRQDSTDESGSGLATWVIVAAAVAPAAAGLAGLGLLRIARRRRA